MPPEVQLARHADRHGLQLRVEDVGALVRHRTPVGDALPARVGRFDRIDDGVDRRLGGAAERDELHALGQRLQPVGQRHRDPSLRPGSPGAGLADRQLRPRLDMADQQLQQRGRRVPDRDAVRNHQLRPMRPSRADSGSASRSSPRRQRAQHLVDAHVEAGDEIASMRSSGPISEAAVEVDRFVDDAAVSQRDPLGRPVEPEV